MHPRSHGRLHADGCMDSDRSPTGEPCPIKALPWPLRMIVTIGTIAIRIHPRSSAVPSQDDLSPMGDDHPDTGAPPARGPGGRKVVACGGRHGTADERGCCPGLPAPPGYGCRSAHLTPAPPGRTWPTDRNRPPKQAAAGASVSTNRRSVVILQCQPLGAPPAGLDEAYGIVKGGRQDRQRRAKGNNDAPMADPGIDRDLRADASRIEALGH